MPATTTTARPKRIRTRLVEQTAHAILVSSHRQADGAVVGAMGLLSLSEGTGAPRCSSGRRIEFRVRMGLIQDDVTGGRLLWMNELTMLLEDPQ